MYPHLESLSLGKYVDPNTAKFREVTRRYNINELFISKLLSLKGYEIVFICDDSGSMNTPMASPQSRSDEAQPSTRWMQLKATVSIVVDLASTLDPDGVDIYFLNRKPLFNVRSSNELSPTFAILPDGATPIVPILKQVLEDKKKEIQERKLLVLLATDGVPTDRKGRPNIEQLRSVLVNERKPIDRVPVTIIACTDDTQCVQYLNDWDGTLDNLDVVTDYESERKQIIDVQGEGFPFSFGDYVVKILLGGVDNWFDSLDEKKVSLDDLKRAPTAATAPPPPPPILKGVYQQRTNY